MQMDGAPWGPSSEALQLDLPVQTLEGSVRGYVKSSALADSFCLSETLICGI